MATPGKGRGPPPSSSEARASSSLPPCRTPIRQVASYVPLTVIITERRGVIRKRMNALDNAREGRATDMLLNYETVKYFCNEKFELAGYDNATRQYQVGRHPEGKGREKGTGDHPRVRQFGRVHKYKTSAVLPPT